jgi:hypothetical protein
MSSNLENSSIIPNNSIDVATVAQAFHFFDAEMFFKGISRALK